MKKYIVLTIVLFCLLFIIAEPVLAEMGGGGKMGDGDRGKASEMMQQGQSMREEQGMRGMGFMHSAGNAYGEYVTFTVDPNSGHILNYGIGGTTLFNMSIDGFTYKSTSSRGSVTWVSNTDGSILVQLHDNPAAVLNILGNKSISVTFTLAQNVTATKEDNSVRIESGGVQGYIVGTGAVTTSVTGTQVRVNAPPNSAVIFRASPFNMPMFSDMYRRMSQEIARNRVGLEAAFGRNKSYNSINYSRGLQLGVKEMDENRISLQLNATEQAGNIISFNLDNSSLVIRNGTMLTIHFDGKPVFCVNDPNIVFNGTDRPLCWISPVQDGVKTEVLMYIPKYSEHTIDILVEPVTQTPTATASPAVTTAIPTATPKTPGFGIVVSIVGLLAWFFLARRRNK